MLSPNSKQNGRSLAMGFGLTATAPSPLRLTAAPDHASRLWYDLHALQHHALDGRAFFAAAAGLGRDIGDALKHIITGGELAESGVLAVEKLGGTVTEKKLRAGGIGMGGARHGDDATHV